jgi:hypothetical protein
MLKGEIQLNASIADWTAENRRRTSLSKIAVKVSNHSII